MRTQIFGKSPRGISISRKKTDEIYDFSKNNTKKVQTANTFENPNATSFHIRHKSIKTRDPTLEISLYADENCFPVKFSGESSRN